jgi:putative transcriptional regulator
MSATSLKNHFLIALPNLRDANFARTVTLICEHGDEGAMGVVINRPSQLHLADILHHMEIAAPSSAGAQPVFLGGPVGPERGFVLHAPVSIWNSTLQISADLGLTSSRDILEAMATGKGPAHSFVALGYAGWSPGQLERELAEDAWISGPADARVIFDLPAEQRWEAAARLLGIDVHLISTTSGHA